MAAPSPDTGQEVETLIDSAFEKCWGVVVWNDPINTMSYVTYVFEKVLKMVRDVAEKHMMEVHTKGKSLVATETREHAELFVHQLQSFGLNATMERVG
ncbi:ATP-dependent Clp protease adaptor protein ClpS [Verrucomicrobium sp. GAS474]|uniref:ATP-dependent Clp protease adapter ClpS n=1 Tax=Verrucomicrobium sp. GAS474 TaxID=1882831 RepID=UPI00087D0950|nr:ATP-dependent Clp protease adapter ClpS [Verrucomicrobium sp. GAS474]SDU15226.1 ATP-dependent Clp protease adaptor protein ClpS [Verrucomicrobium sp. GAS474]